MKKMTHKHVCSISHAELFLTKAFSGNPEPQFKREIQQDLDRLDDVKKFLLYTLYNPELPQPKEEAGS